MLFLPLSTNIPEDKNSVNFFSETKFKKINKTETAENEDQLGCMEHEMGSYIEKILFGGTTVILN